MALCSSLSPPPPKRRLNITDSAKFWTSPYLKSFAANLFKTFSKYFCQKSATIFFYWTRPPPFFPLLLHFRFPSKYDNGSNDPTDSTTTDPTKTVSITTGSTTTDPTKTVSIRGGL